MSDELLTIYVDGSACFEGTPNPKKGYKANTYAGYIIFKGNEFIEEYCETLGRGTINQAEYAAVILALHRARELGARNITILTDASVVAHIVNRRDKIKKSKIKGANEWTPKVHTFIDREFDKCKVKWISRKGNKAHAVIVRFKAEAIKVGVDNWLAR